MLKAKEKFSQYDRHYKRMLNAPPSEKLTTTDHSTYFPEWLKDLSIDANILDIGCGYGEQLIRLHQIGFKNLFGIEVSSSSYEIARKEIENIAQIELIDAFDYLESKKNKYDLVILNDVLEHIPREKTIELLLLINETLKIGGRIVVRVPNMSSIFAQYSMCIDFTHVVGFTEFSLMQVLDLANFDNHKIVNHPDKLNLKSWRPWRPFKKIGIKRKLNIILHKFFYSLRQQAPMPTVYDYNLEIWSKKLKT